MPLKKKLKKNSTIYQSWCEQITEKWNQNGEFVERRAPLKSDVDVNRRIRFFATFVIFCFLNDGRFDHGPVRVVSWVYVDVDFSGPVFDGEVQLETVLGPRSDDQFTFLLVERPAAQVRVTRGPELCRGHVQYCSVRVNERVDGGGKRIKINSIFKTGIY